MNCIYLYSVNLCHTKVINQHAYGIIILFWWPINWKLLNYRGKISRYTTQTHCLSHLTFFSCYRSIITYFCWPKGTYIEVRNIYFNEALINSQWIFFPLVLEYSLRFIFLIHWAQPSTKRAEFCLLLAYLCIRFLHY